MIANSLINAHVLCHLLVLTTCSSIAATWAPICFHGDLVSDSPSAALPAITLPGYLSSKAKSIRSNRQRRSNLSRFDVLHLIRRLLDPPLTSHPSSCPLKWRHVPAQDGVFVKTHSTDHKARSCTDPSEEFISPAARSKFTLRLHDHFCCL